MFRFPHSPASFSGVLGVLGVFGVLLLLGLHTSVRAQGSISDAMRGSPSPSSSPPSSSSSPKAGPGVAADSSKTPIRRIPVYVGLVSRGGVQQEVVDVLRTEVANTFGGRGARVVIAGQSAISAKVQQRAISEFDRRLDDATAAFAEGDMGSARTAALEALGIFEEHLAYTDDDAGWVRYRRLLLLVAEAQVGGADLDGADKTLGQLLAIEPEWKPDPRQPLSEGLKARLNAVRDDRRATPLSLLEVQSRPPGAMALVDGRSAGRAPVAVEIPPGIHYVEMHQDGRRHTERIVLGGEGSRTNEGGGRVTARLASPELETAEVLLRALREPMAKQEFTERAYDVADITVTALVVPWGSTVQVLCGRVTDGELDAVVGTRLPLKSGPREKALFQLVEAALVQPADGWVGGVDDDPGALRAAFLAGVGDPDATFVDSSDDGVSVPLVVGGIIGGVVVLAGLGLGAFAYVSSEQEKDTGLRYGIDTSGL